MSMVGNTWNKLGIRKSKNYHPWMLTSSPPIRKDFDVLVHASWFHWLWNLFPKLHWLCIFAPTNAFFLDWKRKKRKKRFRGFIHLLFGFLFALFNYFYIFMLGSWSFWLLYIYGHMYDFLKLHLHFIIINNLVMLRFISLIIDNTLHVVYQNVYYCILYKFLMNSYIYMHNMHNMFKLINALYITSYLKLQLNYFNLISIFPLDSMSYSSLNLIHSTYLNIICTLYPLKRVPTIPLCQVSDGVKKNLYNQNGKNIIAYWVMQYVIVERGKELSNSPKAFTCSLLEVNLWQSLNKCKVLVFFH